MPILVSLCNRLEYDHPYRDLYLLELEPESGAIRPLELPAEVRAETTGMTGICHHPCGYIAVCQPSKLVYLTPDFQVWDSKDIPELSHGHSVSVYDGAAYVVSTGNDRVLRISDAGDVEVFWHASDSDCDTMHLNGIVWHGSECIVSGFGKKAGSTWTTANAGFAYNTTTGKYLMRSVYHPHSPVVGKSDELWMCESGKQSIVGQRGLRADAPWTFLRGLTSRGMTFHVGSSHVRVKSHSTGLSTGVVNTGTCGVGTITITPKGPQIGHFYDLSPFTDEIYDLVDTEARPSSW